MPAPLPTTQRRVLIVTREYPPAIGPHSIRVAKLVTHLAAFGWSASVVTTPVDHAWAHDATLADAVAGIETRRIARLFTRVVHPRAGLDTRPGPELPSPDDWHPGWRGRLAGLLLPDSSLLWAIPAARAAARDSDAIDVVVTTGPPFSTHLVGVWLRRRGIPWVAEYRDNWTTNPLYRRARPIQALLRRLERWLLHRAGAVVVVSEEARAEMIESFPFVAGRIVVAPNGFDPDDLPPETGRPGTFEIAYAGSLHRRRDPSTLFAVLGHLSAARVDLRRDLRLRLMGNIPRWVVDKARVAIGGDAVSADGLLPHRAALERAGRAAVLLVVSSLAEAGSAAMTSKFLEYLGLRRPILLLAPDGPARRLLAELGVGIGADPTDEPAIEAAVLTLYAEWAADRERRADPGRLAGFTRRATAECVAQALDAAATTDQRRRRSEAMRSAVSAAAADTDQR